MKKTLLLVVALAIISNAFSQKGKMDKGEFINYENKFYKEIKKGIEDFKNKDEKKKKAYKMSLDGKVIPQNISEFTRAWCTDPLSQGNTGTCWCFSTSSFYESEIYRLTKKQIKLSELFTVYYEYIAKATEYVKTRGESEFGEGSETNAVERMMINYGCVPLSAYNGMLDGQKFHNHSVMFNEMKQYLESLKRDNAWDVQACENTITAILNHYLGVPPTTFQYEGKKYTPKQFLANVTGLKMNEYKTFMSLKQHPYYTKAVYDVPDNWWRSDNYNNVPLADFMKILKDAVKKGFTIALGGDVSEPGYNAMFDIAMVPSFDIPSSYINEDSRQLRFTNESTTDDHAIHIVGFKESKRDGYWFLIKDSGSGSRNGRNNGYYFYHEDYVKLKMMSFTVHQDVAKDILSKMAK